MLSRFRNLALLAAALCTTSAFAAELKTVNVPFSFVAKNHTFKPGSYTVAVDWTRSMVTLNRIGKPSQPMTWILVPADNSDRNKVRLTFDVTGADHVLRTIQFDKYATPNLDSPRKEKVESTTEVGE